MGVALIMEGTANKKILIVDDEPDVVSYLSTLLKEAGYDTEVAIALLDALAARDRRDKPRHDSLIFDEGSLHAYHGDQGVWSPVTAREESLIVQGFAGSPKGGKDVLHVNEAKVLIGSHA